MNIFVATSYSSQVNYETGLVFPEYEEWLEQQMTNLEDYGHNVFCALRADGYKINDADPAEAFRLDEAEIKKSDGMLAIVTNKPSEGVQTEIGIAVNERKHLVIAHLGEHALGYFNQALIRAERAKEFLLPISSDPFTQ